MLKTENNEFISFFVDCTTFKNVSSLNKIAAKLDDNFD
jgi:hypothetical protein